MYISAGMWSMTISNAIFAFNFLCSIVIARLLGPEPYGLFIFIASMQAIVSMFISLPVYLPFIKSDGSQKVFDAAWILSLIVGGLNFLIGLIGGGVVGFEYGFQSGMIFFILCSAQLPLVMATLYLAPYEKDMNFKRVMAINGSASVLGTLAALIAAWCGAGLWSLVGREIIPSLILWIMVYRFTNKRFSGRSTRSDCTLLFRESIKFLGPRVLEQGFFRLPFVLIGYTFGQTRLGLFNQAFYLAGLPNILLTPISERVSFAGYTKARGDLAKISKGLFITNYFIFRLITPLGFGIYLFGDHLIYQLYGEKWRVAGGIFALLGLFAALNPLFANVKTACYSLERQQWVSQAYLLSLIVLCFAIIFASQIDNIKILSIGYGIAIATGLGYMLIRLSGYGVCLRLRKLLILPLLYFLLAVFILIVKPMPIKATEDVLHLFILILPYPFLILALEGREMRQMVGVLK